MDQRTLAAYEAAAAADFAKDWHEHPAAEDLQAAVRKYFKPGNTVDIGCGSGREVAWLSANEFPCVGYDASDALLREARKRYPRLTFVNSSLPKLDGVAEASFENVLCETVIMHLPQADIAPSVQKLVSLLRPGGTLYLTWRVTKGEDQRDKHGRLYASFDPQNVRNALGASDILLDEE
ncbi:MAG: class I SAM-dependent methyltransferase, partial [Xanthobacteraceae bacterium]